MNCPSCHAPGAYVGFSTVECPNAQCRHHKDKAEEHPAGLCACSSAITTSPITLWTQAGSYVLGKGTHPPRPGKVALAINRRGNHLNLQEMDHAGTILLSTNISAHKRLRLAYGKLAPGRYNRDYFWSIEPDAYASKKDLVLSWGIYDYDLHLYMKEGKFYVRDGPDYVRDKGVKGSNP